MERNKQTARWLIIAFLFYFFTVGSAYLTARSQTISLIKEVEDANRAVTIAIGERNNAEEMEWQWREMYQKALEETAELREENEQLSMQIDMLRSPTETAYKEIGYDFDYVVRVVGAEARGEPFDGIMAVAECIANTAEDKGATPEQVVKADGQYAKPLSRSVTDGMEDVNEACCRVFLEGERKYTDKIKYFYAFNNCYSAWHEGKTFCFEIGGHRFFKD